MKKPLTDEDVGRLRLGDALVVLRELWGKEDENDEGDENRVVDPFLRAGDVVFYNGCRRASYGAMLVDAMDEDKNPIGSWLAEFFGQIERVRVMDELKVGDFVQVTGCASYFSGDMKKMIGGVFMVGGTYAFSRDVVEKCEMLRNAKVKPGEKLVLMKKKSSDEFTRKLPMGTICTASAHQPHDDRWLVSIEEDDCYYTLCDLGKVPRPDLLPECSKAPRVDEQKKEKAECDCDHHAMEGIWDIGGVGFYLDWNPVHGVFVREPVKCGKNSERWGCGEVRKAIENQGWRHVEKRGRSIAAMEFSKPDVRKLSAFDTPVDPYDMG